MPSAVRPTNVSRVTMQMQTSLLLNNINSNNSDLLKIQTQLTTGLKIARPSDDPAGASTIMHLDSFLEQQQQYISNINYAHDYIVSTDNALSQAVDLLSEAYAMALGTVGRSADEAESNAVVIEQIMEQMISLGNTTSRGSYIFGGQNSTTAPFAAYQNGVIFTGNVDDKETQVSKDNIVGFNVNGDNAFGALSSQVQGTADLDPDITAQTLLSDLNGYLGEGIRLGSILINDGTQYQIDLSDSVTVGDVINTINNEAATITAAIGADGTSLELSSSAGNISVSEVGSGYTARDLGIQGNPGAAVLSGQDVDARLSLTTPVTALAGGAGIDLNNGLLISNSMVDSSAPLTFTSAQTLGDILRTINTADLGVRAEINDETTGINILNQLSGSEMRIGENGGTTAADLGIRSLTENTRLADLNGGRGVGVKNDQGEAGIIKITAMDDTEYSIDLSTADTINDVMNLISAATGGHVTASLTGTGNGIELTDTVGTGGGSGILSVTTESQNGFFVAQQLGFYDADGSDGLSVAGNTLTANDANPIEPAGLFSHLVALYEAMTINDDDARDKAVSQAAAALVGDQKELTRVHGKVGALMQSIEVRKRHMEDNILATKTLRSDIKDVDFTDALTRYQNMYTALEASLMTGGQMNNMTLLDFLR